MSKPQGKLSNKEAARLIARGDQLGYRTVNVGNGERVEPVNLQLQMMFESALAQFRQQ